MGCIREVRKNFATLGKRLRGNWYSILLFFLFHVVVKVHSIKMHSLNAFVCFEGSTALYNPPFFFVLILKDILFYMTFLCFKGYTLLYDLLCVWGPIHLYALIVFHCIKDLSRYRMPLFCNLKQPFSCVCHPNVIWKKYRVSILFLPYTYYVFGKKLTQGDFKSNCNYLALISFYN